MPNRLTLSRMGAAARAREIYPVALVDAHLKRIEAVNPALGRRRRRGYHGADQTGWLHGIPVTIMDGPSGG